jgi:hypothetical protein
LWQRIGSARGSICFLTVICACRRCRSLERPMSLV